MTRTYVTELPETVQSHQVVIDRPTFDDCLAVVAMRGRPVPRGFKLSDFNFITNANDAKRFVDAISAIDPQRASADRLPFGNYQGISLSSVETARRWARSIVERHFPETEFRLLATQLAKLPADKTEIIWLAGERFEELLNTVAVRSLPDELPSERESSKLSKKQNKKSTDVSENAPTQE